MKMTAKKIAVVGTALLLGGVSACSYVDTKVDDETSYTPIVIDDPTSEQPEVEPVHVHNYGTLVPAKENTCKIDGNIAYYHCADCGAYFDENKQQMTSLDVIVPASEDKHSFSEIYAHDEACHWHPATCGHDYAKSEYDFHEFDEGEAIVDATFEETGVVRYTCEVCGATKDVVTPALSHNYSDDLVYDEYTHYYACVDEGYESLKACEERHSFRKTTVAPTCTEEGYDLHECKCGYFYKDNYTDMIPHTADSSKVSIMWEDGKFYNAYGCTGCDEVCVEREEIGEVLTSTPKGTKILPFNVDKNAGISISYHFAGYENDWEILFSMGDYEVSDGCFRVKDGRPDWIQMCDSADGIGSGDIHLEPNWNVATFAGDYTFTIYPDGGAAFFKDNKLILLFDKDVTDYYTDEGLKQPCKNLTARMVDAIIANGLEVSSNLISNVSIKGVATDVGRTTIKYIRNGTTTEVEQAYNTGYVAVGTRYEITSSELLGYELTNPADDVVEFTVEKDLNKVIEVFYTKLAPIATINCYDGTGADNKGNLIRTSKLSVNMNADNIFNVPEVPCYSTTAESQTLAVAEDDVTVDFYNYALDGRVVLNNTWTGWGDTTDGWLVAEGSEFDAYIEMATTGNAHYWEVGTDKADWQFATMRISGNDWADLVRFDAIGWFGHAGTTDYGQKWWTDGDWSDFFSVTDNAQMTIHFVFKEGVLKIDTTLNDRELHQQFSDIQADSIAIHITGEHAVSNITKHTLNGVDMLKGILTFKGYATNCWDTIPNELLPLVENLVGDFDVEIAYNMKTRCSGNPGDDCWRGILNVIAEHGNYNNRSVKRWDWWSWVDNGWRDAGVTVQTADSWCNWDTEIVGILRESEVVMRVYRVGRQINYEFTITCKETGKVFHWNTMAVGNLAEDVAVDICWSGEQGEGVVHYIKVK